ncbi:hypothetical protein [Sediminivirga luteola]|uniref:hypothetical protein n=2 Tax=Sediminivirga luteola TaxID=1774748 RepID=UPI001F5AE245|nr:hypothetical protein [Sediminivirga luteola]MCI2265545.1 hypothetical protein [Sediminivirga luteola]
MSIDVPRARTFMTTHARVLDRHRFEAVTTGSAHARRAIIDALGAYRNPYGGYGWGIEPDLRDPGSQSAGALHAVEAMAEAGPEAAPLAVLQGNGRWAAGRLRRPRRRGLTALVSDALRQVPVRARWR